LQEPFANIIQDCITGKKSAQEKLFRQSYVFAMTIALRYARDEHHAADILSIAFNKVFKYLHRFDSQKGNFTSWLKRIIINEALDFIKQADKLSTQEISEAAEPIIDNNIVQQIEVAAIMQLIRQLPPATHAVFLLFAIDGFSHKEISEQLNISEGTSKWHLSEARKFLQQKIKVSN
jgi:RNA polymerase sigma factor (sigma-70 family)